MPEMSTHFPERIENECGVVLVHFIAQSSSTRHSASFDVENCLGSFNAQNGCGYYSTETLNDEPENPVDLFLGQERFVRVSPQQVLQAKCASELLEQILMLADELVRCYHCYVSSHERLQLQLRLQKS